MITESWSANWVPAHGFGNGLNVINYPMPLVLDQNETDLPVVNGPYAPSPPTAAWPNGADGYVSAHNRPVNSDIGGVTNLIFCDGHVKAWDPSQTGIQDGWITCPTPFNCPDDKVNMWDVTRNLSTGAQF